MVIPGAEKSMTIRQTPITASVDLMIRFLIGIMGESFLFMNLATTVLRSFLPSDLAIGLARGNGPIPNDLSVLLPFHRADTDARNFQPSLGVF